MCLVCSMELLNATLAYGSESPDLSPLYKSLAMYTYAHSWNSWDSERKEERKEFVTRGL